jgi:putative ABC transport system ATP-binding protein
MGSTVNNAAGTSVVECRGVQKSYRTGKVVTPALRGIDLMIPVGSLFMLMGPSGCGKTTLISIIAGILSPDSGDAHVLGTALNRLDPLQKTSFRGANVGFVFQSYNLIPTLTCTENVMIPLLLNGVQRANAKRRAQEMLAKLGLTEKINAFPANLSGGQQQRVAIARALVHEPRLVVCDEPTSALDHQTGAEVMELFAEERAKGERTFIIVTHDSRILPFADAIGFLDDGRVVEVKSQQRES